MAGLGNFTKAVGKGMGGPCFRIIQTHFASQNNVGDVAAKEQVSTQHLMSYCLSQICDMSNVMHSQN